jgi:hypothetical protein
MASVLSTLASLVQTQRSSVDEFLRDPRSPRIIEFADWATTENASDIWQKAFTDKVKRSTERDYQFIFHLGDIAGKKVFEIDEVLDIIGDFSSYGKVSMILETQEADILWCRLNGRNDSAGRNSDAERNGDAGGEAIAAFPGNGFASSRDRYQSIFNTMRIDYLAVLQGPQVQHFSREGQIQLASPELAGILGVANARTRFSIGCQLGVLLGLDCPHSVALGLAVSGAWSAPATAPDTTALLSYMNEWQNRINN